MCTGFVPNHPGSHAGQRSRIWQCACVVIHNMCLFPWALTGSGSGAVGGASDNPHACLRPKKNERVSEPLKSAAVFFSRSTVGQADPRSLPAAARMLSKTFMVAMHKRASAIMAFTPSPAAATWGTRARGTARHREMPCARWYWNHRPPPMLTKSSSNALEGVLYRPLYAMPLTRPALWPSPLAAFAATKARMRWSLP